MGRRKKNSFSKKNKKKFLDGEEKYTRGELAQLARRRMLQKKHEDSGEYSRKAKHKRFDDI